MIVRRFIVSKRARFSYDAWGRPRNPNNWTDYTLYAYNTFFFLKSCRGFTGHEHLVEFDLINANGRIYDPTLGQFMQPDNYVQMPESAQSYNRYAYCLNNPLKYTDPSGELFTEIGACFGVSYLGAIADAALAYAIMEMASQGVKQTIEIALGERNKIEYDWGLIRQSAVLGGISKGLNYFEDLVIFESVGSFLDENPDNVIGKYCIRTGVSGSFAAVSSMAEQLILNHDIKPDQLGKDILYDIGFSVVESSYDYCTWDYMSNIEKVNYIKEQTGYKGVINYYPKDPNGKGWYGWFNASDRNEAINMTARGLQSKDIAFFTFFHENQHREFANLFWGPAKSRNLVQVSTFHAYYSNLNESFAYGFALNSQPIPIGLYSSWLDNTILVTNLTNYQHYFHPLYHSLFLNIW